MSNLPDLVKTLASSINLDILLKLNMNGVSIFTMPKDKAMSNIIMEREKELRLKNIEAIYKENGVSISANLTMIKLKLEPIKKYSQPYEYDLTKSKKFITRRRSLQHTIANHSIPYNTFNNSPPLHDTSRIYDWCWLSNIFNGKIIQSPQEFLALPRSI